MQTPEILVHTSAPTTKQNDDIYHTIAENYIQFQPYRVHNNGTAQNHHQEHESTYTSPQGPVTLTYIDKKTPSTSIITDTSQDNYGSFPSQIYSMEGLEVQISRGSQVSTQADTAPTSSRLEQLERLQYRWREQQRTRPSVGASWLGAGIASSTNWEEAMIDETQLALQCMESQVMDGLSITSEDTQEDEKVPETRRVPKKLSTGTLQVESSLTNNERSVPEIPVLADAARPPNSPSPLPSIHESYVPDATDTSVDDDSSLIPVFNNLPSEILPPPPEVNVDSPTTLPSQITHFLATIKQQNPRRFKPMHTFRRLQHDERGHWMIDCHTWPLDVQLKFWNSFGDYVRSGRVGWGASLYRENAHFYGLGIVRAYCWGEIVEHIWISLWLCSKGKIADSGSRWLDAGGEAVINMS